MKSVLRIANVACFVLLLALSMSPVGAASVTAGNRSNPSDVAVVADFAQQHVQQRIDDMPAIIPAGPSPFHALGRREVSEYQYRVADLNPAGCTGDGCDENRNTVVEASRVLDQDKKWVCKKKGKSFDEGCEDRDSDGCCLVEDDESGEGNSDESEAAKKKAQEKKEAKSEADKKAEEKKEAHAEKKKEEAEAAKQTKTKVDMNRGDDGDSTNGSFEDKMERKKGTGANKLNDEQTNRASDNDDKKTGVKKDGGNKSDLPEKSKPSEGEYKRKEGTDMAEADGGGKPDTSGETKDDEKYNKSSKPKMEKNIIEKKKVEKYNKSSKPKVEKNSIEKKKETARTSSKDGNRADPSYKKLIKPHENSSGSRGDGNDAAFRGNDKSRQSSKPKFKDELKQEDFIFDKIDPPKLEDYVQDTGNDTGPSNIGNSDRSGEMKIGGGPGNRGEPSHPRPLPKYRSSEHRSSRSNRSSIDHQDIHSPGKAGPVPTCLSICRARARSSTKKCRATSKSRSRYKIDECVYMSKAFFDDCEYSCIQGRGAGQIPEFRHGLPNDPGGSKEIPNYPDDRPRSRPGGGTGPENIDPRPSNGMSDNDDECDEICEERVEARMERCEARLPLQQGRTKHQHHSMEYCQSHVVAWRRHCIGRCQNMDEAPPSDDNGQDGSGLLPTEVILCKATCKSNVRSKESWCNRSSEDEREEQGVSDDNCSQWADTLRFECYDGCYKIAKVVEAESIPKEKQSGDGSKNTDEQKGHRNDPVKGSKPKPEKAAKEKRKDDVPKAQDTSSDDDQPWIANKISNPKNKDDEEKNLLPNKAGVPTPQPPLNPHPHFPGAPEQPSEQINPDQGSSAPSSNPVDISNNVIDIDSFAINLSIALRSNGSLETIKVRSNSVSAVRVDHDNVRNRLIIQDGVIRVLRHVLEEELGYHVRQEQWDRRLRQLRQRELVTLHHDIDQTTARTVDLGATSRNGLSVKWINFFVFYDIIDFLTNDHSSLITGLDVALRSAGSVQSSHLHTPDQQPHHLLTGRQIASAARAAVSGRIRDGTLLQLLRFRGVDALAVTEFGNEANVSLYQGWIDKLPSAAADGIPITTIDTMNSDRSWDPTRLVGAGVFVLVFALVVGTAQWTWYRRRRQREMEWTTAGAQEHFHRDGVEYEKWQTRISPGEGTPSETGGSMIIDVNNAIQSSDNISSLGIGTFSEASMAGWQPRQGGAGGAGRYSREPSNFSSIVHNAYDSVSPSDAALDLIGEELDANSRGQLA